jgi:NAD(P)-dependent dehydrogenase (short-subunit alcohol dehydrogenase family)
MELGLAGKTVIVTGGGSNIGRGITLAFAKEKCNVVIADIDEEQLLPYTGAQGLS